MKRGDILIWIAVARAALLLDRGDLDAGFGCCVGEKAMKLIPA